MLIIFLYTLPAPPSSFTIVYNFYCYFLVYILYCSFFSFCSDYLIILFLLLICMCKLSGTFQQGRKFNSFDKTLVRHRFFLLALGCIVESLCYLCCSTIVDMCFDLRTYNLRFILCTIKCFFYFYTISEKNWIIITIERMALLFPIHTPTPLNFYYIQIVTQRNVLFSLQFE